jgi:predicted metal-dependent hydrolase
MQLGLPFAGDPVTGAAPIGVPAAPDPTPETLIFVRHRRARRYVLRICPDGRVRVTIPRGGTRREAVSFVERHRDWIAQQRARVAKRAWGPDSIAAYRVQAQATLPGRLLALAARHGLSVERVSIGNQRTRWGSCGHNRHISLNWRLVLMPEWVSDYVLIHELMHLRRMDHSVHFWKYVADACPGYRDARAWLRANGPTLR